MIKFEKCYIDVYVEIFQASMMYLATLFTGLRYDVDGAVIDSECFTQAFLCETNNVPIHQLRFGQHQITLGKRPLETLQN